MIAPIQRVIAFAGAGLAFAGAGLWLTLAPVLAADAPPQSARSAAEIMDILMWNREPVGGPFALTDQAGHERTDKEFRGKLMLIYFGFTTCPDICPTDLQAIALALDKLGRDSDQVQPIFITVDPERDTAAHLADYVPMFHPRLIGLTGKLDAIRKLADAYKVYFARVPLKDAGDYTVDHTAYIYLMDREGNYLGFFPPGTSADRMVEIIRPRLAEPGR
ncbi:cytochrome oxidase Cu insertion factor (SCO1/SenC/PrrC family) [Bradyrhizobium sp. USDA 4524]|uniref:SCO family protein n=1 Tax=unclassified Bradyrhizobium TaxID=2631580 RepID=UPI00209D2B0A|nr:MULTISPECIES: SCO family protein [unclassified Bradyrhizobium]MCP1841631.1 protein SCO1/2 [Bradyrhizobium sp. USDA 4538]MCP1902195.1 protein SCO1/2 [Bradyrhizobium sp. USDA 4537]MCP1992148.1 protein SCO1/2 [Bradyrhizobium sp. USDA 4539]